MSIQERREQAVIEESVKLDEELRRITVQLPFIRDPVKFLVEKHRSDFNYGQAVRVYASQCHKEPQILEGIRKAHSELVNVVLWSHWTIRPSSLYRRRPSAPTTCGG